MVGGEGLDACVARVVRELTRVDESSGEFGGVGGLGLVARGWMRVLHVWYES